MVNMKNFLKRIALNKSLFKINKLYVPTLRTTIDFFNDSNFVRYVARNIGAAYILIVIASLILYIEYIILSVLVSVCFILGIIFSIPQIILIFLLAIWDYIELQLLKGESEYLQYEANEIEEADKLLNISIGLAQEKKNNARMLSEKITKLEREFK